MTDRPRSTPPLTPGNLHLPGAPESAITPAPATELAAVAERAREYARASRSPATRAAYRKQWRRYAAWCRAHGATPLPATAAVVALYLTQWADEGAAVATMAQALSAISVAHAASGEPSPRALPAVREVWQGIRRTRGVAQRQAAPVGPDALRAMVRAMGGGAWLAGLRDRALLLLGFAGAFRRSELVALDVADIAADGDGLRVTIRRSKVDQEGAGATLGVPYGSDPLTCPVRALRDWLGAAGIAEGAVFRGVRRGDRLTDKRLDGGTVGRILRRAAKRAGIPLERLSGHSLRAGLATTAAKAGKRADVIARQGRWRSTQMVARYVRDADIFGDNAASGIGL